MESAPAPHTPGICEDKAQLERSYKEAEAAFGTARIAIRQKVGTSSKAEYLKLDRAAYLPWDQLQRPSASLLRTLENTDAE